MNTIFRAILALSLVPSVALAAGADLRRAERRPTVQCKTIGATAQEMFQVSCATCSAPDRKSIWLSSGDVTYSTNSIRISSYATTSDNDSWPWRGWEAFKMDAGPSARIFVRRSPSEFPSTVTVCGLQLE